MPIDGVMYYNWNEKMQRVDHGGGSYECVHFYGTNEDCSIYFTPDGLYRVLSAPLPEGQEECCLDMVDIHATPPDWAITTNPTYNGIVLDEYSNVLTHKYTFDADGSDTPHMYYEAASASPSAPDGAPVKFTFPVDDGRQDFRYDPKSMKVEPQDASLFVLPDGCQNKLCDTPSRR